ncbi:RNA-directed DNA polymerase, eukaryota, reverse transcriptase zinc-binding domain protein [Tanacetum coccineum]|uniref:RNA-directed DNA polymerase, eukaryota, reverse transcriptase zinc-binding domain protein n=1 Tax=Tanacetum coccineum TaxID=301880 RepID=A0ABQ4ZY14_9ASTR
MLWHQNSECQTTPTEFWCHGISGAKLHFADVTPLLEFGTKSLAPRLPVLLVNIFVRHASHDRIPHLVNLDNRDIDADSILCSLCQEQTETSNRMLFTCHRVRLIWLKIFSWWGIQPSPTITMSEILSTSFISGRNKLFLKVFKGACFVSMCNMELEESVCP